MSDDTIKELKELGYSDRDVADMTGVPLADVSADSALRNCVVPDDTMLYGQLEKAAERLGIDVGTYAYRAVRRVLEKMAGGMNIDVASRSAGLKPDEVKALAQSDEGLRDMMYAIRHEFEMKAQGAIMRQIEEKSDGRLALDVLSRQTEDFQPAKNQIEVNKTIDIRDSMVLDARDLGSKE